MRVVLAYKNFAANRNVSHIGLGVAGLNNMKSLRKAGIESEVWPLVQATDLTYKLRKQREIGKPVTHVVVSAPWIDQQSWNNILFDYPEVVFAMNCHSNVGFLQADSQGVDRLGEAMDLEMAFPNFHVAGNCKAFVHWIRDAYGRPCAYLPNMYYLDAMRWDRPVFSGNHIRIGCFGATRPLKNILSAGAAAIEIASRLRLTLEFWISAGRTEGGGDTIVRALHQMYKRVKFAELKMAGWEPWPQFRKTVGNMHLLIQPSYTESFNMVTADGIAEGVCSVVSPVIEWVPDHWKADNDDVFEIARVGRTLLFDNYAAREGFDALQEYVEDGLRAWAKYLNQTGVS